MKHNLIIIIVIGLFAITLIKWFAFAPESTASPHRDLPDEAINDSVFTTMDKFVIERPFESRGLQIFMITGITAMSDKSYITLSEALANKKVTVHETGNVDELSIDNDSDGYVFIHSGDIVKGGKQDRTMAYDIIVPPKSKNIPLKSFCVESGRWQKRGHEDVSDFQSNTKMLSSKELRLAAKYEGNQGKVWNKVSKQQEKLNKRSIESKNGYYTQVNNNESASSLQLTLESEELNKAKQDMAEYFTDLLITSHSNAIGYAYAINGEIYGVDVYNDRQLFNKYMGESYLMPPLWKLSQIMIAVCKPGSNRGDIQAFCNGHRTIKS